MISPTAIFEMAAMKVKPEFNSNTLPMSCQVEKHINGDEYRYNSESMFNLAGDFKFQRIMTKFDVQNSYRSLLAGKNKEAIKHMKKIN